MWPLFEGYGSVGYYSSIWYSNLGTIGRNWCMWLLFEEMEHAYVHVNGCSHPI